MRRLASPSKRPELEWVALTDVDNNYKRQQLQKAGYPTWDELRAIDVKRKVVLGYARDMSPMDTVGKLHLLRRTVVPRLLRHVLIWIVLLTYGTTATIARMTENSNGDTS